MRGEGKHAFVEARIELSDAGLINHREIVELVFGYINMLNNLAASPLMLGMSAEN